MSGSFPPLGRLARRSEEGDNFTPLIFCKEDLIAVQKDAHGKAEVSWATYTGILGIKLLECLIQPCFQVIREVQTNCGGLASSSLSGLLLRTFLHAFADNFDQSLDCSTRGFFLFLLSTLLLRARVSTLLLRTCAW